MARTTRSSSKVTKPAVKPAKPAKPAKATTKKSAKVEKEIKKAVEEEEEEEAAEEEEEEEKDFQLPSDSESEDDDIAQKDADNDDSDETDSELAIHEDVISEGKESSESTTNKSGHIIIKPSQESKGKKKVEGNTKRGVIYIGRLPSGFEEKELKTYFQQFGDITRLRLSRNKKSGKSKHYGFIEFREHEVAKIAAETMNNYLLMGHLLKCTLLEDDQIHENLFVGANMKFKVVPFKKISLAKHDKKRTEAEWKKLNQKHVGSLKSKQEKLNAKGIDFDISEL